MDLLVRETGVSRHGIYNTAGDKAGLFRLALDDYREFEFTEAFAPVEVPDAGFAAIEAFIDAQITRVADRRHGCLIGNTLTERAAHDPAIRSRLSSHLKRVETGLAGALRNEAPHVSVIDSQLLARIITSFLNGLWAASHTGLDAQEMRLQAHLILSMVRDRLAN